MSTATLTNTIKDPSGTAQAGVVIEAVLMPSSAFRTDHSEVVRYESTTTDVNGVWTLTLERNDQMTPDGTYWQIIEKVNSPLGPCVWACLVTTNSTLQAALVTPPPAYDGYQYLTQDAGDARYLFSSTPSLPGINFSTVPRTTAGYTQLSFTNRTVATGPNPVYINTWTVARDTNGLISSISSGTDIIFAKAFLAIVGFYGAWAISATGSRKAVMECSSGASGERESWVEENFLVGAQTTNWGVRMSTSLVLVQPGNVLNVLLYQDSGGNLTMAPDGTTAEASNIGIIIRPIQIAP